MATWQFLLIFGGVNVAIGKASKPGTPDAVFGVFIGVCLSVAGAVMLGMRA